MAARVWGSDGGDGHEGGVIVVSGMAMEIWCRGVVAATGG
ncbi:hypothetical protein Tco_1222667, partial [Tanacetum coccineum]